MLLVAGNLDSLIRSGMGKRHADLEFREAQRHRLMATRPEAIN